MEFSPDIIALTLSSGIIIGFFLGLFGGGGSVLAAPLLLYVVGITNPHVAIGTSAAAVSIIAIFNLLGHWKGGQVKWPCAIVFASAGLIGSVVGSSLAKVINGQTLLLGFASVMAVIGLTMFRSPKSHGSTSVQITPILMARLAPLGLIVGLAAGFFGIGGGFLIVPGLMLATGMTLSNAAASSLVSVAIFGAATSTNYALSGWVNFSVLGLLLVGGLLGGIIGIIVARKMSAHLNIARRGFAAMIIIIAGFIASETLLF